MNNPKSSPRFISLEGKNVVISGAASGIGLASAKLLYEMNASVYILDMNDEKIEAAVHQIDPQRKKSLGIRCDVTKSDECDAAVQNIITEL